MVSARVPMEKFDNAEELEGLVLSASSMNQATSALPSSPLITGNVSLASFVGIAYFLVCGGPYGLESAIEAGGITLTIIGLLVMPFVWSIPQAMMTAELATMMPENGGSLIWVSKALGPSIGAIQGYNNMFANVIDRCIYPNIIVAYLYIWWPSSILLPALTRIGILISLTIVNVHGLQLVGSMSAALLLLTIAAFTLQIPAAWGPFHTSSWFVLPPQVNWAVLTSVLLWASTGWDSLGAISGEVRQPHKNIPIGIAMAVCLTSISYIMPIVVSYSLLPDPIHWARGNGFAMAAQRAFPGVGAPFITLCAVLSNMGLLNAGLAVNAHLLAAMGSPSSPGHFRTLPAMMATIDMHYGTPRYALWAQCAVMCVVVQLDLSLLLQFDMVFTCFSLLVQFAAFISLRYSHKDTIRPYEVPGGLRGAWAMTAMKCAVIGVVLVSMIITNTLIVIGAVVINLIAWFTIKYHISVK